MRKNVIYMQNCIMNEATKLFRSQQIADKLVDYLNKKKDIEVTVYDTDSDGFIIRRKKDGIITDDSIITGITKAFKELIDECDDFDEIISDVYEFDYDKKLVTEEYLSDIVIIRHSGRLISIEIDLQ